MYNLKEILKIEPEKNRKKLRCDNLSKEIIKSGLTRLMVSIDANSSETFDIIQYGQAFNENGDSGKQVIFYTPRQMFSNIDNYNSIRSKIAKFRNDQPIYNILYNGTISLLKRERSFRRKKEYMQSLKDFS